MAKSNLTRPHKGAYSGSTFQGESAIQARVIAYLRKVYPDVRFYGNATANIFQGGNLGPQRPGETREAFKARQITAGGAMNKMKRSVDLGAVDSWPDIQICRSSNMLDNSEPLHGLFIELKDNGSSPFYVKTKGIKADERARKQAQTLSDLCQEGYFGIFCIGDDDARLVIDAYLGNTNARNELAKRLTSEHLGFADGWIYKLTEQ